MPQNMQNVQTAHPRPAVVNIICLNLLSLSMFPQRPNYLEPSLTLGSNQHRYITILVKPLPNISMKKPQEFFPTLKRVVAHICEPIAHFIFKAGDGL